MSISKKAQQRLHFLRRLKKASLPPPILTIQAPYLLKHGPSHPPPPPQLTTSQKIFSNFFVQFKVCYTQVITNQPVQTTCRNTLSSICTRNVHTLLCVHNSTKDSVIYSGYGKYSDPLKFFTLCYIAAIC